MLHSDQRYSPVTEARDARQLISALRAAGNLGELTTAHATDTSSNQLRASLSEHIHACATSSHEPAVVEAAASALRASHHHHDHTSRHVLLSMLQRAMDVSEPAHPGVVAADGARHMQPMPPWQTSADGTAEDAAAHAITSLLSWPTIHLDTASEAMRLLLCAPLHSAESCTHACTHGCNPQHAKGPACTTKCEQLCRKRHTLHASLATLVRKAVASGHDLAQLLEAHAPITHADRVATAIAAAHQGATEGVSTRMSTLVLGNRTARELAAIVCGAGRRAAYPSSEHELQQGCAAAHTAATAGARGSSRRHRRLALNWASVTDFDSFSLTFIDIILSAPPLSWSKQWGNKRMLGDLGGAAVGGVVRSSASAWFRAGLFGGGMGIDIDNLVTAEVNLLNHDKTLFLAVLAFKLDTTYRNALPDGLLASAADFADSALAKVETLTQQGLERVRELAVTIRGLTAPLRKLLRDLPETIVTTLAQTLPSMIAETAAGVATVFSMLEGILGMEQGVTEARLDQMVRSLDGGVRALEQLLANATFIHGMHSNAVRAHEALGDAIAMTSWLVGNASTMDILSKAGGAASGVLRGALTAHADRCAASLPSNFTNRSACPSATAPELFGVVTNVVARTSSLFADLASNDTESASNRFQAALRTGDMRTAIRIASPALAQQSGVDTDADAELASALELIAAREYAQAEAALAMVAADGSNAPPYKRAAAREAWASLQLNQTGAAAQALARNLSDSEEMGLALAALATADTTAIQAAQVGGTSTTGTATAEPRPTTNALQGLRDVIVPLLGVSAALVTSSSNARDTAQRAQRIDVALGDFGRLATGMATIARRLLPSSGHTANEDALGGYYEYLPPPMQPDLSVGAVGESSCSLEAVGGLAREIMGELRRMGFELAELPGPSVNASSGRIEGGVKCKEASCIPMLLPGARAALVSAVRTGAADDDILMLLSAYRSPVHQYILHRWGADGRCGVGAVAEPGESQEERGLVVSAEACDSRFVRRYSMGACMRIGARLAARGFTWLDEGSSRARFLYSPSASYSRASSDGDDAIVCGPMSDHPFLSRGGSVQDCAGACSRRGLGCTLFVHEGDECRMVASLPSPGSTCPSGTTLAVWTLTGASVPPAEDLRAAGLRAFQRLWNANRPTDMIAVDGVYNDETAARFELAPADGFSAPNTTSAAITGAASAGSYSYDDASATAQTCTPRRRGEWPMAMCRNWCAPATSSADCEWCECAACTLCASNSTDAAARPTPSAWPAAPRRAPPPPSTAGLAPANGGTNLLVPTWAGSTTATGGTCDARLLIRFFAGDRPCAQLVAGRGPVIGIGYSLDGAGATDALASLNPPAAYANVHCDTSAACAANVAAAGDSCLSQGQVWQLFEPQLAAATTAATRALASVSGELDSLCCAVRNTLVDMAFALGDSLVLFRQMLEAIDAADWQSAATHLESSSWGASHTARASAHAATLRTGCTAEEAWDAAPRGAGTLTAGSSPGATEAEAGYWSSFWGSQDRPAVRSAGSAGTGTPRPGQLDAHARAVAVGGLEAYDATVRDAREVQLARVAGAGSTTAADVACASAKATLTANEPNVPGSLMEAQEAFDGAVLGTHAVLFLYGGRLDSVCCDVQQALVDFYYAAGPSVARRYRRFWASVALSEWSDAADALGDGAWCLGEAARCAAHQASLRAGCTSPGEWLLSDGFIPNARRDFGLAQRMAPPYDIPGDPSTPSYRIAGHDGYTPDAMVKTCLADMTHRGRLSWWAADEYHQPGAAALGAFVNRHFGHMMRTPYVPTSSYQCIAGAGALMEGRVVEVALPTWPCANDLVAAGGPSYGHPTCAEWPGGRARNELGDPLVMWLVDHASSIGIESVVFDRTQWHVLHGFREWSRTDPYVDRVSVTLTRKAAATMHTPFYSDPEAYAPTDDVHVPLLAAASSAGVLENVDASDAGDDGGGDDGSSASAARDAADGSLLGLTVRNAHFVTDASGAAIAADGWGADSVELVVDVTVELSGTLQCPDGWSGDVALPLAQEGIRIAVLPANTSLESQALPWLAHATAKAMTIDPRGELRVGALVGAPHALLQHGSRCSASTTTSLGALASAQQCATACARHSGCDVFTYRPRVDAASRRRRRQLQGSTSAEGDCLAYPTASAACASEGLVTADGVDAYRLLPRGDQRWWAAHEQLRLNTHLVQSLAADADGFCELRASVANGDEEDGVAQALFARRHLETAGGAVVLTSKHGIDASLDAADATAALSARAVSAPVAIAMPPNKCDVICPNGGVPRVALRSVAPPPRMSQRLAIALDNTTQTRQQSYDRELNLCNTVEPLFANFPGRLQGLCQCTPSGAWGLNLTCGTTLNLVLFNLTASIDFIAAICAAEPTLTMGFNLGMAGLDWSPLRIGPFGFGQPLYLPIRTPYTYFEIKIGRLFDRVERWVGGWFSTALTHASSAVGRRASEADGLAYEEDMSDMASLLTELNGTAIDAEHSVEHYRSKPKPSREQSKALALFLEVVNAAPEGHEELLGKIESAFPQLREAAEKDEGYHHHRALKDTSWFASQLMRYGRRLLDWIKNIEVAIGLNAVLLFDGNFRKVDFQMGVDVCADLELEGWLEWINFEKAPKGGRGGRAGNNAGMCLADLTSMLKVAETFGLESNPFPAYIFPPTHYLGTPFFKFGEKVDLTLGPFTVRDGAMSFALSDFCPTPLAAASNETLPGPIAACLDALEDDYSTCGISKALADARFVECARTAVVDRTADVRRVEPPPAGAEGSALTKWWLAQLAHVHLPEAAIHQLGLTFDCARFTELQAGACTCTTPTGTPTQPARSADAVGCIADSLGVDADPLADNAPDDVRAATDRLTALGFNGEHEHQLRMLSCAAMSVDTFEAMCDLGVAPCSVNNVSCPKAHATDRSTCLLPATAPCALGRFVAGSSEASWLRARNAPGWQQLPRSGAGFVVGGDAAVDRGWATSWVAEALVRTGRAYNLVRFDNVSSAFGRELLKVRGASSEQGGALPRVRGFQTGLQLEMALPREYNSSEQTPQVDLGYETSGQLPADAEYGQGVTDGYSAPPSVNFGSSFIAPPAPPRMPPMPTVPPMYWGVASYNRETARVQMRALIDAGFTIYYDDPQLCTGAPFCLWAYGGDTTACMRETWRGVALCHGPPASQYNGAMDHFIAALAAPLISHAAPLVHNAVIDGSVVALGDGAAGVRVNGVGLGLAVSDVLAVRIGPSLCTPLSLSTDRTQLQAQCRVGGSVGAQLRGGSHGGSALVSQGSWLRGSVEVITLSAGTGTSCGEAVLFVPLNASVPELPAGEAFAEDLEGGVSAAQRGWEDYYNTRAVAKVSRGLSTILTGGGRRLSAAALEVAFEDELRVNVTTMYDDLLAAVDTFEASWLPSSIGLRPLKAVCTRATGLRDRTRAFSLYLGALSRPHVTAGLQGRARALTSRVYAIGAADHTVRATMARCWNGDVLRSSASTGFGDASTALRKASRRLAASVGALQGAWQRAAGAGGINVDFDHVARLAGRVNERRATLAGMAPLAFSLAHSAEDAQPLVTTLAAASTPTGTAEDDGQQGGGVSMMLSPLTGAGTCTMMRALDQLATRATMGLPQLQLAQAPLARMMEKAEALREQTALLNLAGDAPREAKGAIVDIIVELTRMLDAYPPDLIRNATGQLSGLNDVLFDRIGGVVERILAYLESSPAWLEAIGRFILSHAGRAVRVNEIEQVIALISSALDGKGGCKVLGVLRRFAEHAAGWIDRFVPPGARKQKLMHLVEQLGQVTSSSDLINAFIGPALTALHNATSQDALINSTDRYMRPLLEFASATTVHNLGLLRDQGQAQIGQLVNLASDVADGLLDDLATVAMQLGADLFDQLLPDSLQHLVGQVRWIHTCVPPLLPRRSSRPLPPPLSLTGPQARARRRRHVPMAAPSRQLYRTDCTVPSKVTRPRLHRVRHV